jgi:hypothetical protein
MMNDEQLARIQFIIHHSSFIIHRSSFIVHHSSFIIHRSSFRYHHRLSRLEIARIYYYRVTRFQT